MRVVLLGDSHLDRVRRRLPVIGPDVVNAAVGGALAVDVLAQARRVPVTASDVAVLSIGTNDSMPRNGVTVTGFSSALEELLAAVSPGRWVYVLPPLGSSAAYAAAARTRLDPTGATLVDTAALLAPLGPSAFTDDGIHLTGAAYDVLLPAIRQAVLDPP